MSTSQTVITKQETLKSAGNKAWKHLIKILITKKQSIGMKKVLKR